MKILVTDCSNQIGVAQLYLNGASAIPALPVTKESNLTKPLRIDYSSPESCKVITEMQPDVVIHNAGMWNHEECERDPDHAFNVNVLWTYNIIANLRKNTMLVYIGTDRVYDGEKGNYTEKDPVKTLSVFARTKLRGEDLVKRYHPTHIITRQTCYGFFIDDYGKIGLDYGVGQDRQVFSDDRFLTPISSLSFSNYLAFLLENARSGLYNFGSRDRVSEYQFASMLNMRVGLSSAQAANSSEVKHSLNIHSHMHKDVSLNLSKLEQALSQKTLSLKDDIEAVYEMSTKLKQAIS